MPRERARSWSTSTRTTFDGSFQSKLMLRACGVLPSSEAKLCASSRTFVGSGPLTRNLSGQPTGGPSSRGLTRASTCSNSGRRERGKDPLLNACACLEALGDHHGLRKEVVGELLVERQVEADRTAADIERPALDVRIGLQHFLDLVDHLARRIDRGALRKRQIDQAARAGPSSGRTAAARAACRRARR